MTPILLMIIAVLLMVVYVLVNALIREEKNTSYFVNELGKKAVLDWEQERLYSKLKRIVTHDHAGVEHQLFMVSVLIKHYSQHHNDIDADSVLSDLLLLQCFLLDVLELTGTPIKNPATYPIRQQVRDKCRASSWDEPARELKP